jgi:acyl-CoA synthetase (AMP-forming)/AMP-acid ligase II
MIIVSGFNVYPNEVESVAAACSGVAECACVGKPDQRTGEGVRLFVATAPGATLTEEGVIAHCPAGTGGLQSAQGGALFGSATQVARRQDLAQRPACDPVR